MSALSITNAINKTLEKAEYAASSANRTIPILANRVEDLGNNGCQLAVTLLRVEWLQNWPKIQ